MDSDSDEEWWDNERPRRTDRQAQQQTIKSFYGQHKPWFREGLEIEGYEFATRRPTRTGNNIPNHIYYHDIYKTFDESIYLNQPTIFQKSKLKIISTEEAICIPIEERKKKILIKGRINCGQAYSDDIVYAQIENNGDSQRDGKYYGKVISFVDRNRFKDIEHPILICSRDRNQGHLMVPICTTVPKINVLHGRIAENRLRTSVEIHKYDPETRCLVFDKYLTVKEDNRQDYLFIVVLIKWKSTNIYPLGATLGAIKCCENMEQAMTLLCIQHNIPIWSEYSTLNTMRNFRQDQGILDVTQSQLVFSIGELEEQHINYGFSVSQKSLNGNTRVGIHVTDISRMVEKGDPIDTAAKLKGFSFHQGNTETSHSMLPEQMYNLCNLDSGQMRHTLAVFVDVNDDGDLVNETLRKCITQSSRHYSYSEAEDIIKNIIPMPDFGDDDIRLLHATTERLRFRRMGCAALAIDAKINFSPVESFMTTIKSRNMVEELIMQANQTVGKLLHQKFPMNIPLFNTLPIIEDAKMRSWYRNNMNTLCLAIKSQGQTCLDLPPISIRNLETDVPVLQNMFVSVRDQALYEIFALLDAERYSEAILLLCCDYLYPKQAIALSEMLQLTPPPQYTMSLTRSRTPNVQFTHPLDRYGDIIAQRLIHAYIDNSDSPYSWGELREMCSLLNRSLKKKRLFDDQYQTLEFATCLKQNNISFECYIVDLSEEEFNVLVPGLQHLAVKPAIKYKDIGVCNVPIPPEEGADCAILLESRIDLPENNEIVDNPEEEDVTQSQKHTRLLAEWRLRLYSYKETVCELPDGIDKPMIYPHQKIVFLRYSFWKELISQVTSTNNRGIRDTFLTILNDDLQDELRQDRENFECSQASVSDVSSETHDGLIVEHAIHFGMCLHRGQTISVQFTSQEEGGKLTPVPQILHLTNNVKICLPHVQDPIKTFSRYAERSSIHNTEKSYRDTLEYQQTWIPIVEMESTLTAVRDRLPIIINDIPIKFSHGQGRFDLSQEFCNKRDLDFGYIPETDDNDMVTVESHRKNYHTLPSCSYLCIMFPQELDEETKNKIGNKFLYEDKFTWSGHAETTKICKYVRLQGDGQRRRKQIRVVFKMHERSSLPTVDEFDNCRLEVIHKSSVDRRLETNLKSLHRSTDLAKNISLGKHINVPDRNHFMIAEQVINQGLNAGMWDNNMAQEWAIKTSLKKKFKLIQGPPGTGKTYIGVKLIHLFNQFNNLMNERNDSRYQIVFCGPSNKSVDLVARYVLDRLDRAPNIVRVYGGAYEQLDYPVPGKSFDEQWSLHDTKTDPILAQRGVVLHHIIRQQEKPYANRLQQLDEQFRNDIHLLTNGEPITTTVDDVKEYKDIQSKATKEELPNYDVIFCTASMVANPKVAKAIKDKVYQLIIDESGMCSEPSTVVPIIASAAKQVVLIGDHKQLRPIVKCREAAKLGLETSLFERYSNNHMYRTMLTVQYRMHPAICEFPSRKFYEGKLRTAEGTGSDYAPLSIWPSNGREHYPHVFCHVGGKEERLVVKTEAGNEQSRDNRDEVEHVVRLFEHLVTNEHVPPETINIMSQYNAQCTTLRQALDEAEYTTYNVSTVVQSQGGEWNYVIFSLVRSLPDYEIPEQPTLGWKNQALGFITDQNQINVALTRAKRGLIIIGNTSLLKCDPVWNDLINDYRRKGCVFNADDFPVIRND